MRTTPDGEERRGAWRLTLERADGSRHVIGAIEAPEEIRVPFHADGTLALDHLRIGLDWRLFVRTMVGEMSAHYVEVDDVGD